ncbi:MAG TPA: NHL repeat-containing protein [Gemmatimonadaceae bacterium]|jgi:DNA-binding beta-propeller fold protein YncE|nr:NHL repeat-containing protein [Gemmatimonadaceae bacterium]
MNRGITLVGALLLLSGGWGVGASAAQAPAKTGARTAAKEAPKFEVDPMWPKPMGNRWILGSTTGVAIDSRDHIFVVHLTDSFTPRTEIGLTVGGAAYGECCASAPNVLEFDPSGALVAHWGGPGEGYNWPEQNAGLAIDDAGNFWIGGAGGADSRILKFSKDGKFIAQYGTAPAAPPPVAAAGRSGGDTAYAGVSPGRGAAGRGGGRGGRGGRGGAPALPANSNSMESFGGAMGFAIDSKANEIFVADGSRNHRVAVVDMNTGAIKRYWGAYGAKPDDADTAKYEPGGAAPKQFGQVRCVRIANDGLVYVCDATNDRIQIFKKDGSFVKEATVEPSTRGSGSVWDIAFSRDPGQKYVYVADGANDKVHILDRASLQELTAFGDGGRQPGLFYAVDGVATDSKGNLYTIETFEGKRLQKFNYKGVGAVTKASQGALWPSAGAKK